MSERCVMNMAEVDGRIFFRCLRDDIGMDDEFEKNTDCPYKGKDLGCNFFSNEIVSFLPTTVTISNYKGRRRIFA